MNSLGAGIIVFAALAVVVLGIIFALISRYRRVPPSKAMVIYGRAKPRLITSGGAFVIPILEEYKMLDLTIITLKTERDEVYTESGVPIQLDWVAQVQIASDEDSLNTASRAFLDKTGAEIKQVLLETLSANFRAIVGQMTVEAIHRDRDDFVQRVQDLASDDVTAMGVRIISMGIEEITDNEGYLQAMAAPKIAAVKRDATIAQAEAEREARVKAANAKQQAEQAELHAEREILAQREALSLREVEVHRRVDIEQAAADREIQEKRALAVEQQQEAEVLVPARATRQAVEIRAEAERRRIELEAEAGRNRITITAEAEAKSTRDRALADAEATEKKGAAEAAAYQALELAKAAGQRAQLLAEAEGRRELAAATAAEDSINLRQFIIEEVTRADVAKVEAIANALAGLGGNVRVVDFGSGGNGNGSTFSNMLMEIPEIAEMFRTKVEALSGEDFDSTVSRVMTMFESLRGIDADDFGATESEDEATVITLNEDPIPHEADEATEED